MPDPTPVETWPEVKLFRRASGYPLYRGENALRGDEAERYVPLHVIRERLLSDEASEAAASESWMRQRVKSSNAKGRSMLAQWEDLAPESRERKIHESSHDLRAAFAAAFPEESR